MTTSWRLIGLELRKHAPYTALGTLTGIVLMALIIVWQVPREISASLFWICHPAHVLLSALVTAADLVAITGDLFELPAGALAFAAGFNAASTLAVDYAQYGIVQSSAGIPVKLTVLTTLSFITIFLLYHFIIRRTKITRVLFGMKTRPLFKKL